MGTTKKKLSPKEAADTILKEMIIKFGVNFTSDFDDLEQDNPLYVALCDFGGDIKPTPIFPRRDIAETFVELCRKYVPNFNNQKARICKLTAV